MMNLDRTNTPAAHRIYELALESSLGGQRR
jgi:hypothetical protein